MRSGYVTIAVIVAAILVFVLGILPSHTLDAALLASIKAR